jgi:hypothetical protein
MDIYGFVDADWAGYLDHIRSRSGFVFNLFGGPTGWMSKRQVAVSLSTTKAKYMPSTHACKEPIWLQILCSSIGLVQLDVRLDF